MKSYENGIMKKCSRCGCLYTNPEITFYIDNSRSDKLSCICRSCKSLHRINNKSYYNKYNNEYYKNNLDSFKLYRIKHEDNIREYGYKYRKENKIYYKKYDKEYRLTETSKLIKANSRAKRRKLKFIPLFQNPFPKEIEVDYHHINDMIVIPVPRLLHKNNLGNEHRQKMNKIIKEFYYIDLDILLNENQTQKFEKK